MIYGVKYGGTYGASYPTVAGGGGGGGTPFALWPSLTREDLPASMSTFAEPTLPTTSGGEVEVTTSSALASAAATPGTLIRITASYSDVTALFGVSDIDIIVDDGVSIGGLTVISGSTRVRLRGAGSTSAAGILRVGGSSTDVVFDSLLSNNPGGWAANCQVVSGSRIAYIAIVGHSNSATSGIYQVAYSAGSDILFAGCRFGAEDNGGMNDWGYRQFGGSRIIFVDSQIESRAGQHAIRRSATTDGLFVYRTTTVNLYEPKGIGDVFDGAETDRHSNAFIRESTVYMATLTGVHSLGFGGLNATDGIEYSDVYEAEDMTWHTEAGTAAEVNDSVLASLEAGEWIADSWEYRLGAPSYNSISGTYGAMHPGWTSPASPNTGVTMSTGDPYSL